MPAFARHDSEGAKEYRSTMKALVLRQHGSSTISTSSPIIRRRKPAEGHVVIRVRAASFNYHDVFTVRGMPGIKVPLPVIIGLDMAGEIAEVGAGVTGWKAGDRVLVNPVNKKKGLMGEMLDGGMAEYCARRRRPAGRHAGRRELRGRRVAAGRLRHRAPHADHPRHRESRRQACWCSAPRAASAPAACCWPRCSAPK